jgi:hypothetical protein
LAQVAQVAYSVEHQQPTDRTAYLTLLPRRVVEQVVTQPIKFQRLNLVRLAVQVVAVLATTQIQQTLGVQLALQVKVMQVVQEQEQLLAHLVLEQRVAVVVRQSQVLTVQPLLLGQVAQVAMELPHTQYGGSQHQQVKT